MTCDRRHWKRAALAIRPPTHGIRSSRHTMADYQGVGPTAPRVHSGLRIVVAALGQKDDSPGTEGPPTVHRLRE